MKQTVKVPLADIKDFKKNSSFIKSNSILPIYGYIKFDNGTMSKHSREEFVIQQSNFSGSFLVEEKVLFNFIEYATSSDILFSIDDKKATMTDGRQKQNCATEDTKHFPKCEEPPKEQYNFDDAILKAIGSAAHFTREDEIELRVSHVFIGNKTITASDGIIAYCKEFDSELPTTAIYKSIAERISKMPAGKFSETERKCFYPVSFLCFF